MSGEELAASDERFANPLSQTRPLAECSTPDSGSSDPLDPERDLNLPAAFIGFDLIAPLGQGTMAKVWKARQVKQNRVVALKIIRVKDRVGSKDLVRLLKEAEALAALRHPHIVQLHEAGEAGGRPYLAMEYLAGGSLAHRVGGGKRLDPSAAARLVATLAGAVQAAHDLGIVHRDLKPSNVLFDLVGQPKVADFGLAQWSGRVDLMTTRDNPETPTSLPPEQPCGKAQFIGPAADVHALGGILYECLTGTRPFEGVRPLGLLPSVVEEALEPPSRRHRGIARDVELICLKCLAKSPADRYPSAQALAADLSRFAAGQPATFRPASGLERALRWVRSRLPLPR